MKRFLLFARRRKVLSFFIAVLVVVFLYFAVTLAFKGDEKIGYRTSNPVVGMITTSLSSAGQVFASTEFDLKPKTSGDLIYMGAKKGDRVKKGTLLFQLDYADAAKVVRDAEVNLESALLSFEKLKQPADVLSIIQAENSLSQAQESKIKAQDNLNKAYEDGFNAVSNAFLDLPEVMTGMQDLLFSSTLGVSGQWNLDYYREKIEQNKGDILKASQFRNDAFEKYSTARVDFNIIFVEYKAITRFSERERIEELITKTHNTARIISESIKSMNNLIQLYQDTLVQISVKPSPVSDSHLSILSGYTGKMNSHLSGLLSSRRSIEDYKESIINAERSITERAESLRKLKSGPDELDIKSYELTITQRENALRDAKNKYADYFIYAPFDGVVADVKVKKGDAVSSGTSLASFITEQMTAELTFNEIDIAKVKLGQKVILTFDAIDELSITGEIIEIDTLGQASQGVVSYGVKVGLDVGDERVKSGMSITAAIITDLSQDTLAVPNSALKSQGGMNYVEVLVSGVPERRLVTLGISNDTMTEVLSGLAEDDLVITQTISNSATASPSPTSPPLGGQQSVGGVMRIIR